MAEIIIYGLANFAKLAQFYFNEDSPHRVVAFTVDKKYIKDGMEEFSGVPVVAFEDIEEKYSPDKFKIFIAIGYRNLNHVREKKYLEAKGKGYELVSYICSKAVYWGDTEIGDNCFILENQVIQPTVKIGNDVIIWSGNHFGHDVIIGDHSWLSSQIVVSGGVEIGPHCFVGINASIRDSVKIGKESIIGAGSLILRDVKEKSVFIARQTELYKLNSEQFERMMEISPEK